jgi:hypothetical protein
MNTSARTRPREKGENCPWRTDPVTKIKMVTAWVIEIDGPLNQSKAEQFNVEVKIALRITGNRGNVMKTGDVHIMVRELLCFRTSQR